jgi:hypothetical protein
MTTSDKEYFDARFKYSEDKIAETRAALEARIDMRFNELRAELHQTIANTVKWCAGIVATGLLLYTTMLAFLMNNSVPRTAPVAPAAQTAPVAAPTPQPIVIVVPLKS